MSDLALANWMIEGEPGFDIWGMDISRFGDWAGMAYTNVKVRENYSRRFSIRFPNEELPAGRPLRTTPIYDRLIAAGAQMGTAFGLEQPLWFAPDGLKDEFSWRRSTDFAPVGEECRAVRQAVGLGEISGYAKYEVCGPRAGIWLDWIFAGRIPKPGRMALSPMLNTQGKLIGDFSIANLGDRYFLVSSGPAESYHMRWFSQNLPADGTVQVSALGLSLVGLTIAGPNARALLASVTHADVSAEAFRFMNVRHMDLGMIPCRIGRVTFTGDLGYEIWVAPEYQHALFDLMLESGRPFGVKLFGGRAVNALRLEKNFGTWAREYRPIYGPYEAELGRFVDLNKDMDFIGRSGAEQEKADGGSLRLRSFVVEATDSDPIGDEPIWHNGEVKGWVTSGGYAHASEKSVALGYVPRDIADEESADWEVEILGVRCAAALQNQPLFDPNGGRLRG